LCEANTPSPLQRVNEKITIVYLNWNDLIGGSPWLLLSTIRVKDMTGKILSNTDVGYSPNRP
jgi:hypothetical protein